MSEYTAVKASSLKLKGSSKSLKKKKKSAKRSKEETQASQKDTRHEAWWKVCGLDDLRGNVLLECEARSYVIAIDDGSLTATKQIAAERKGPIAQEVFTIVAVSENRIALKTPFNRYVAIDPNDGSVAARVEAIGTMELFQPIMNDDGGFVLKGANKKLFKAAPGTRADCLGNPNDAGTVFYAFSSEDKTKREKKKGDYEIEGGSLNTMEENFAKRFQSFQNGMRLNIDDRRDLKRAKTEGRLHEQLLDRRAKMKADRYCK